MNTAHSPASVPDFDQPLAMLSAGHERIESQLAALERLAGQVAAKGCDEEVRGAARGLLRYFDGPGAEHHRDEDEDLFPLLRERAARGGRAEIAAVMDELQREHASLDTLWSRLRGLLAQLSAGRSAALDSEDVLRFAWLNRRHMDREAMVVFPYAAQALAAQDCAELGKRMARRRHIESPNNGENSK